MAGEPLEFRIVLSDEDNTSGGGGSGGGGGSSGGAKEGKKPRADELPSYSDLGNALQQFLPSALSTVVDKLKDTVSAARTAFSGGAATTAAEAAAGEKALAEATAAAGGAMAAIPGVGIALAAALAAAGAASYAFTEAVNYFVRRGQELAQYSGPLSEAQARSEVRDILADIREAQALGPEIARLTDAQSKLETDFREITLPIKQFLVETLSGILTDVQETLNYYKPLVEQAVDLLIVIAAASKGSEGVLGRLIAAAIGGGGAIFIEELLKEARAIRKAVDKDEPEKYLEDILQQLDQAIGKFNPARPQDPVAQAARQALNLPLLVP